MFKVDNFYYSDSGYQLELNLQRVRLELVTMLEDFEKDDCTTCKQLKCCCSSTPPLTDSGRNSQASKSILSELSIEAPPATQLPKPKFDEGKEVQPSTPEKPSPDVEAWVRSVTPSAMPTAPELKRYDHDANETAFNWSGLKLAWDRKPALDALGNANGVEAFFRSFKGSTPQSPAQTSMSYMSSRLAAAFKITPKKSCEYTYF